MLKRVAFLLGVVVTTMACSKAPSASPPPSPSSSPPPARLSSTDTVATNDVVKPSQTASAAKPQGDYPDGYYFIANQHKHPLPNGPTAGWNLVIRKADHCLLVIATEDSADGSRLERTEMSVEDSGRFERDPELVRSALENLEVPSTQIEAIIRKMADCPGGYHHLSNDDDSP